MVHFEQRFAGGIRNCDVDDLVRDPAVVSSDLRIEFNDRLEQYVQRLREMGHELGRSGQNADIEHGPDMDPAIPQHPERLILDRSAHATASLAERRQATPVSRARLSGRAAHSNRLPACARHVRSAIRPMAEKPCGY